MKKVMFLTLLWVLGSGCISAQVLNAFMGTTPVVNGTISAGEWSDASQVSFSNGQGLLTVYFKHDGNALYFAADIIDSFYYWGDDIVISLDPDHNAGTNPQTDDIELYIRRDNTTSVLYQGSGSGWVNMSNIAGLHHQTSSSSNKWQAECSILYSRLGIIAATPKTVGVEFRNYDDSSGWFNYPSGGDEHNPDTWADLSITFTNSVPEGTRTKDEVKVFPNPAKDILSVETPQPATMEVFNAQGNLIKSLVTSDRKTTFDVSYYPAGVYFIRIISDEFIETRKFIKQ